jgi:hypothetical protein
MIMSPKVNDNTVQPCKLSRKNSAVRIIQLLLWNTGILNIYKYNFVLVFKNKNPGDFNTIDFDLGPFLDYPDLTNPVHYVGIVRLYCTS